jgi:hypothetical protein
MALAAGFVAMDISNKNYSRSDDQAADHGLGNDLTKVPAIVALSVVPTGGARP